MSTRCLTVFRNEKGEEICVMYRHCDGYPKGHGKELRNFLKDKTLTDGLKDYSKNIFNGMGCLTASVIAHFKNGPGHIYVYPAGTRDVGEDYIYTVFGVDKTIKVITRST